MATIIFSKVSDDRVRVVDKIDPKSHKTLYRVVETGFESLNEKRAIRNARKYLHGLTGVQDRKKEPKKESAIIRWKHDAKTATVKISNDQLLSIAEEIKKFKEERKNETNKKLTIESSRNNQRSSKRNVSGIRLDPQWREVYRR